MTGGKKHFDLPKSLDAWLVKESRRDTLWRGGMTLRHMV